MNYSWLLPEHLFFIWIMSSAFTSCNISHDDCCFEEDEQQGLHPSLSNIPSLEMLISTAGILPLAFKDFKLPYNLSQYIRLYFTDLDNLPVSMYNTWTETLIKDTYLYVCLVYHVVTSVCCHSSLSGWYECSSSAGLSFERWFFRDIHSLLCIPLFCYSYFSFYLSYLLFLSLLLKFVFFHHADEYSYLFCDPKS